MTFLWSPAAPPLAAGTRPPTIRHVLYEYDGPRMVVAVDEAERQLLGVAVDEDYPANLSRWVFAPLSLERFSALLAGARTLRALYTSQQVRVIDIDAGWNIVHQWELDGTSLPDELLPDTDAALPELTHAYRDELLAELAQLREQDARRAHARLFFGGKPVVGSAGIHADFATTVLGKYQSLVAVAFSARQKGAALGSRGPIPDRDASALFITDMPRGSVGFELAELSGQAELFPSELAQVVSDVGELIEAAASGDQDLAESIAELDPRVHPALRDFFGVMDKAEASFRLEVHDRQYVFDQARIRIAAERTATDPREELDRPVRGTLIGYLPAARRFELRNEAGDIIRGRIAREAVLDELKAWLDRDCIAYLRIVTVARGIGEAQAFTLLRVEPLPP